MHNRKSIILAQLIDLHSHESRLHQPTRSNYAQLALRDTTHTLLIQSRHSIIRFTRTRHSIDASILARPRRPDTTNKNKNRGIRTSNQQQVHYTTEKN
jgi:hypothetical protein